MGEVQINRPGHLALRDKNYEKTLNLLKYAFGSRPLASRKKLIHEIVERLETAYEEAHFALLGVAGGQLELDFVRFLKMVRDASRSVKHMVDHEEILERDTSFLRRFLRNNPEKIKEFKDAHRLRSEDILQGVKVMAGLTEADYLKLKKVNYSQLSEDEQRRYMLMVKS